MIKTVFARLPVLLTVLSLLCAAGGAQAQNLVQNGGFELTTGNPPNTSFFLTNGNGSLDDWSVPGQLGDEASIVFVPGGAESVGARRNGDNFMLGLWGPNNGGNTTFPIDRPGAGNFVAFDGDPAFAIQTLNQTITGLVPNTRYKIKFDWAAAQYKNLTSGSGFDGATTSSWQVTLGSQTFTTPVVPIVSNGFSGWMTQSFTFGPYNGTGTELLTFLAVGTPNGLPPVSLLDNVSLVPEPGSLLIVGIGLLVSVAVGRFRAKSATV